MRLFGHYALALFSLLLFAAAQAGAQPGEPEPVDSGWVMVPFDSIAAGRGVDSSNIKEGGTTEGNSTEGIAIDTNRMEPSGHITGDTVDSTASGDGDTLTGTPEQETTGADAPRRDATGSETTGSETTGSETTGTETTATDTATTETPSTESPQTETPGTGISGTDRATGDTSGTSITGIDTSGTGAPIDTLTTPLGDTLALGIPIDSLLLSDTAAPPDPLQQFLDSLASVEMSYDSILQQNPYDMEARLNRGRVRSWLHNFDSADADLRFVVESEPENIEAINAMAYNQAWQGNYDEAETLFKRSLEVAPDQVDAAKGLAYVALWEGNAEQAVEQFASLANHSPDDPELQVGLGQAQMKAGRTLQARNAFKRALTIDPARSDAREALSTTKPGPVTEITGWLGNTWSSDIGNNLSSSRSGIRFAEVATSPVSDLRLWLQYDNGMTFDNVSYALRYRDVPAYYVGGYMSYDENLTTRVEIGFRKMPGDDGQYLLRGEHVVGLDDGYTFKFGGWGTFFDDNPLELILHTAFGIPMSDRFRAEPTLIYAKTGLPGEFQLRAMMAGEFSPPSKWQIGGAAVVGMAAVGPESTVTTLWDAYVRISAPVGVYDRMHFLLRHEAVRDFNSITVLAAGLTIVIGR